MNLREPKTDGNEPSGEVVAKANELYWHSEESVNQLTRQLDLSKGALYEILAPLPAHLPCPRHDGELSYPNRTARDRGFVSCATCGFEDEEDQVRALLDLQGGLQTTEAGAPAAAADRALPQRGASPRSPDRPRPQRVEVLVVLSVVAGLAAGLILGGLFRRR